MASVVLASLNTVGLIFGGCCSNVFTLESIIKTEPDSGLLITFFQFLLTALVASVSQITTNLTLAKPAVPLRKWAFIAAMFFAVNMLNNWAFAFSISVPLHIILRSFGSVTTMLAGVIKGKRFSGLQVASVVLLTVGVLVSAFADAASKGKSMDSTSTTSPTPGLLILLAAQILSAYMGVYVQDTYAQYGSQWRENLFYSHFLSLPLFLPLTSTLQRQFLKLSSTPSLTLSGPLSSISLLTNLPSGIAYLLLNALTQLACISGVNLLSAQTSAVTVTIVLNVRKLVSFVASTVVFGHRLSGLMILGSGMVFGAGALYGWETSWRIPKEKARKEAEGKKEK